MPTRTGVLPCLLWAECEDCFPSRSILCPSLHLCLFEVLTGHQRPRREQWGIPLPSVCATARSPLAAMAPMVEPSCVSSSYLGLGPGGGNSFLPLLSSLQISLPSVPSVPCSPCMDTAKCFCLHFAEEEAGAQDHRACQGHRACEGQREDPNLRLPKLTTQRSWQAGWIHLDLHGELICCF